MTSRSIKILLFLGGLVIFGIIFSQFFYLYKNWDLKDEEFDQTVNIVLRNVAEKMADFTKSELPKQDLIKRRSSNIYAVNTNSAIDANVLEDYLVQEFGRHSLNTDFEYAVYDCFSDNLVYGNYCSLDVDENQEETPSEILPRFDDLVYYFVVKFPSRESYLLSNMRSSVMFSLITSLSILFFLYAMFVIVRQKKLSELQKDFINNMTHEFKTPISSIKIASDVLASTPEVLNNPRYLKYAEIIKDQNNRLNNQVEKVLNIAKIENNNFKLNLEEVDVVSELRDIIKAEGAKTENAIITTYFHKEEVHITADKLHLANVVSNIIDNAIKYSKDQPIIEIRTSEENNRFMLSIKDHGIGISKDQLKHIHEKFYRVSTGDVHNVKGFGLGLFYVKNICSSHGWDFKVQSEKNNGTEVTIAMTTTNKLNYE